MAATQLLQPYVGRDERDVGLVIGLLLCVLQLPPVAWPLSLVALLVCAGFMWLDLRS